MALSTLEAVRISARLDRLPATRTVWRLITLLSLGLFFELYDPAPVVDVDDPAVIGPLRTRLQRALAREPSMAEPPPQRRVGDSYP